MEAEYEFQPARLIRVYLIPAHPVGKGLFATNPQSEIVTTNTVTIYTYSKVGNHSRGWPEGSLFNSYYP